MPTTTLAIAAPSFSQVSETFIRDHVCHIAPGSTVLICQDEHRADVLGMRVLPNIPPSWHPPRTLAERIANSATHRWRRYIRRGLSVDDQARLVAFLQEHRPRALMVEFLNHAPSFISAARKAGIPLFAHAHGYEVALMLRDTWEARHARRLFEAAAGIIAPSRFLAERIVTLGCDERKLSVVPCGVDPTKFQPTHREPLRLLAVGRLVEKKAPQHTVAAFAKAKVRHPRATLDWVGDGPLRDDCVRLVARLGVAKAIRFLGAQPHETVLDLMGKASVFVQHSVTARNGDTEGLPVAILEAMSCALPVVASRHSGIPEAVVHGKTGLLVPEHDVDGMATAIDALLDDPEHARAMGEAGRRRVLENFTQKLTATRLRSIFGIGEGLKESGAVMDLSDGEACGSKR
jgi:colanic acid/amylovoran biosynthesis glycosyltransferase